MNILLVAAEYAPYLSERPTAESVANLAKALRLLDHAVTVIVPKADAYQAAGLAPSRRLSPLAVIENGETIELCHVFDQTLPTGVKLILLDMFCAREVKSLTAETSDVAARAQFIRQFGQAVGAHVSAQAQQGAAYDVVHAHDCEVGLALLSIKSGAAAKVLSVHDATHVGSFPRESAQELGLSEHVLSSHGFGLHEEISLLKGLLSQAEAVIVPSESYGRKLQAPEHHGGMARAFQAVSLIGITEGIDQAMFNPATDPALSCHYDGANPVNKGRNRAEVLRRLELEFDPERPIIFAEYDALGDPGWATLMSALPGVMRSQVTMILVGGEGLAAEPLSLFTGHVKAISSVDPATRRQILAASDFYLSVRRKDPSGRTLMQASRYGAVPIAYQIDSVPDVLVDCDMDLETGNSLLYESMTQRALQTALARAVRAYRSPRWPKLLSRVMRRELTWDRAARRHVQVYNQLLLTR